MPYSFHNCKIINDMKCFLANGVHLEYTWSIHNAQGILVKDLQCFRLMQTEIKKVSNFYRNIIHPVDTLYINLTLLLKGCSLPLYLMRGGGMLILSTLFSFVKTIEKVNFGDFFAW